VTGTLRRAVGAEIRLPVDPSTRPGQIRLAIWLLTASTVAGVIVLAPSLITDFPTDLDIVMFMVGYLLVYSAVAALTIYKIYVGRNWARWLCLFFVVFTVAVSLYTDPTFPLELDLDLVVNTLLTVCDVVAVVLLFIRPGSQWFRKPIVA
jgi:hypothetical protein